MKYESEPGSCASDRLKAYVNTDLHHFDRVRCPLGEHAMHPSESFLRRYVVFAHKECAVSSHLVWHRDSGTDGCIQLSDSE
ncbi:hypothetical protein [Nitrosomonas sp. HPC101]|uniref:hypothetical protein n=1 Tax=Nitrosomonas sp. HPC101 TaxID=1658667 RepID=UPI00136EA8F0|nr:hypothetical protein [Nitrosomonas sp. HPC101]